MDDHGSLNRGGPLNVGSERSAFLAMSEVRLGLYTPHGIASMAGRLGESERGMGPQIYRSLVQESCIRYDLDRNRSIASCVESRLGAACRGARDFIFSRGGVDTPLLAAMALLAKDQVPQRRASGQASPASPPLSGCVELGRMLNVTSLVASKQTLSPVPVYGVEVSSMGAAPELLQSLENSHRIFRAPSLILGQPPRTFLIQRPSVNSGHGIAGMLVS